MTFYSVGEFANELKKASYQKIKNNKKISYYNVASAYDSENSSFYIQEGKEEIKRCCMYAFIIGIGDLAFIGRSWDDFINVYEQIVETLKIDENNRLIIYVHNLTYDFQFFRKWLDIKSVFALSEREIIYAVTEEGIEFRCSFKLAGYSLETIGKNLQWHDVKKLVGDLDYNKVRSPSTPLTKKEIGYIENDYKVVIAYIEEEIKNAGNITKIPLTKTGKVRNYCRNVCLYSKKSHKGIDKKYFNYRDLMKKLTIKSVLEYQTLKYCFMGGFTHGNHLHVSEICNNVVSYDFTSDYPAKMVLNEYPMGRGEMIKIKNNKDFRKNLNLYCCIFRATFTDIKEAFTFDHYISSSKCLELKGQKLDNGRIIQADKLSILLTEQDFFIIEKTYKWKSLSIKNFRRYQKFYLPKNFILSILDLYEKKTTLKGVKGMEVEYMSSKENINSAYGMTVTDICRPEITYEGDEWGKKEVDLEKTLDKYNKDTRRFLFYPWGIWVTAYARRDLWDAIIELGEDYRYSDTDSVKFVNHEKHKQYFENYNQRLESRLKRIAEERGIDFNKMKPKTQEGKEKLLGAWDYEENYSRFKYLGAKRYMTEIDDHVKITVSGLRKDFTVDFLRDKYKTNDGIFNAFKEGMYIPKGHTGKQIHSYIDEETEGDFVDYLGKPFHFKERSGVHLENADYTLSLTSEFIKYIFGIEEREEL